MKKSKKTPRLVCCGEDDCDCKKEIKVYFCPKCKSPNVKYVFGLTNLFGVVPKMVCLDCNFTSQSFPILITNKKEIKKFEEKKKTIKKTKKKKRTKI